MSQHDYTIANQGFPATRADINNALSAIATNNSGTSAPSTQYAGQFWIDTTSSTWTLYIHDGTDDIQFATIDTSANTVNFTDSALDVVTDTTPQLGGDLDLNSNDITGTGDINITGDITATNLSGTLPVSNLSGLTNFKNIIINGDMSIAQRGTSTASITSSGYYTVDRWSFVNGSLGTFTMSQSTDVPTGQGFATSLKLDCTTADASPASGDNLRIRQNIEGQMLQYLKKGTANAESLTLSFWVKSTKTGTFICELRDDSNARQIAKSYTIIASNTWEKKTITFEGDTTGAFANSNAQALSMQFWLGAGTDFTSGTLATSWESITNANRAVGQVNIADDTANDWFVTGVQLEAGTTASDFEFLPVDVNLQRCKRYCQEFAPKVNDCRIAIGECPQSNRCDPILKFSPEMRAAPSFTFSAANTFSIYSANTSTDLSSISLDSISSISGNLLCNVATTPFTSGSAGQFLTNGTSSSILASAEL